MDAHDRASGDTFEALWMLRACYPKRSGYDAASTLSMAEAIQYGEELLREKHLREPSQRKHHRAA